MKNVDKKIAEQLWKAVSPEVERYCQMVIVRPGIRADRGETKAETLCKLVLGMMEQVYKQGLDRGFDMGADVFGTGE